MLKCYTTGSEPEEMELTQARERLKKAIEQIGGDQAEKLLRDLWLLEDRAQSNGFTEAYREAFSETLPFLPARRLVELIKKQLVTTEEALAALDEKRARLRRDRESPEARAA